MAEIRLAIEIPNELSKLKGRVGRPVKAQHHSAEAGAVHEAHFLLSQFLHYAQTMAPERLS